MDRSRIATDVDGLSLGDLKPGTRVGDYKIESTMAARGTGVVYRAMHMVLPRLVAIKVMPALASFTRHLGTQLLREACLLEALDHPGVARVYECGVMPDKRPWVAMELVEGNTLSGMMSRLMIEDQKLSIVEVARLIRDVAEVLEHVHRRGVVHCNLGGHAIVLGGSRRFPVTLADWSSARTFDSNTPVPLLPHAPGSPHLSPEQRVGGLIEGRTDVYALGVAAYRALYNEFPHPGANPPPSDLPPMLVALVTEMLAREVLVRPTSDKVIGAAKFFLATLDAESRALELDSVLESIDDEPSSGVPTLVTFDVETALSGRPLARDDEPVAAGEIDISR